MRPGLFTFFFLCCVSLPALPIDTALLRVQYDQARSLIEKKQSQEAAVLAHRSLRELSGLTDRPTELEVGFYHVLGDCAFEQGDFPLALKNYETSRQILDEKQPQDELLRADSDHKLGNFYLEMQDFATAWGYLEKTLEIRRKKLGNRHLKVAEVYNNIGNFWYFTGDAAKALEFHSQALDIRRERLTPPHPQIAQSLNNIGLDLEKKGDREGALDQYQSAIDVYSKLEMPQALADVYTNLAGVYGELGYPAFFLEYQSRALHIWQKSQGEDHPFIALCYTNLANYYTSYAADYQKAFQLHQKALSIRKHNFGIIHPQVAATYYNIGVNYYFNDRWEQAREAFLQCFQALNYQPGPHPVFEAVNDNGILLQLFERLAETHIDGYNKSGNPEHLSQAFSYLEQADALLDYLRIRFEPAGSKLHLAEAAHPIYDLAIELALVLFQINKENSYLEKSFVFSEKSKSILLLEALKKTEAEVFSGIPKATIAQVKALESTISQLEKTYFLAFQQQSASPGHNVDSLAHQIFENKQLLSALIHSIEQEYPVYFNLRYASSTLPVEWIQANLLGPEQSILEFFLGSSQLHIFVINKNDFQVRSVEVGPAFYDWLHTVPGTIRQFPTAPTKDLADNIRRYGFAAHQLYQVLIEPVRDIIEKNLIIIPDGALGFLPFDALLSSIPEDPSRFGDYPFLIRDYTISYNYSSALLKEMTTPGPRLPLKPYLGFAPIFTAENTNGLSPLKYNDQEVLHVKRQLGGQVFLRESATKRNFLEHQSAYKIIHLATHGKVNTSNGNFSFLAFSESPDEGPTESVLFEKDIYNITTHAELVVLSACDSGTGALLKGEGIASIARSFSYIGAKSLIATQWSADDQSTQRLISSFFSHISRGTPKDVALREAKVSFLSASGNKYAHPFFWASFVAVGNMDPILANNASGFYFWLLFAVAGLNLYIWWVWKTRGRLPILDAILKSGKRPS